MTIFCYSLYAKLPNCSPKLILVTLAPFGTSGGSLGILLFLVGLGSLFHCSGMCSNHDDYLIQIIGQSAPKLVLVTLRSFGPP